MKVESSSVSPGFCRRAVFAAAFRFSVPVLLGYLAIGVAFGLMLSGSGYPWTLALVMSVWMYAGAGQYLAVGLFGSGAGIFEAALIQLVVNSRHFAYGLAMLKKFASSGPYKPYLVFSLTDETFALLSSLEDAPEDAPEDWGKQRRFFMFCVAALNHCYWITGSLLGAIAGSLIPFDFAGVGFALNALFVVLLIEQIKRVTRMEKKEGKEGKEEKEKTGRIIFVVSGASALAAFFLLPPRFALLASLVLALILSFLLSLFNLSSGGGDDEP